MFSKSVILPNLQPCTPLNNRTHSPSLRQSFIKELPSASRIRPCSSNQHRKTPGRQPVDVAGVIQEDERKNATLKMDVSMIRLSVLYSRTSDSTGTEHGRRGKLIRARASLYTVRCVVLVEVNMEVGVG